VNVVNFFSSVCLGEERQICAGNVRWYGLDGKEQAILLSGTGRYWRTANPYTEVAERLLSAAKDDAWYVAMAFFAIAPNDFRNLHSTLEAVQAKLGGGEDVKVGAGRIDKLGWLSSEDQFRIKKTANSYEDAGVHARHVKPQPRPENPITRFEARRLIQDLLVKVLNIR
jgi:hypothetical protein